MRNELTYLDFFDRRLVDATARSAELIPRREACGARRRSTMTTEAKQKKRPRASKIVYSALKLLGEPYFRFQPSLDAKPAPDASSLAPTMC